MGAQMVFWVILARYFETDLQAYKVEISDDMFIFTREVAQAYKEAKTAQAAAPTVNNLSGGPNQ